MSDPSGHSYDVRVFAISKYAGTRGTTYTARWRVAGERMQKTFGTRKLADSFRSELVTATRNGAPFDRATGLPVVAPPTEPPAPLTWFEFARQYAAAKWPTASPRHRKGIAEALTGATAALVADDAPNPPDAGALRAALNGWAFVGGDPTTSVPSEHRATIEWLHDASLPLADLAERTVVRRAAEALARTLDGLPAAAATTARKRATFHNALEHAVEQGHLATNTLRQIKVTRPPTDDTVDRRVVVNPEQARELLAAVAARDPVLEGFFACLYYAGLRPSEARNLRRSDCFLPETGWGQTVLTGSHQYSGARWSESDEADEERALKHRAARGTRPVPLHPLLVATLRRHLDDFGTGADNRLFVTRTGKAGVPISPPYLDPVSAKTIYRAWHQARKTALSEEQFASVLAKRPYDLRHACLST
jgi:integrase